MAHWLASPGDAGTFAHVKRFDPRYWSVNFPRPMMASAVRAGAQGLRVDCTFYRSDDLAGLIWDAAFVLMDADSLLTLPMPVAQAGVIVKVAARAWAMGSRPRGRPA